MRIAHPRKQQIAPANACLSRRRLKVLVDGLPDTCLVDDGSGSDISASPIGDLDLNELWQDTVAAANSYSTLIFVSGLVAAGKAVLGKVYGEDGIPCGACVGCAQCIMGVLGTIFAIIFLVACVRI